jgi:hypothetical protein
MTIDRSPPEHTPLDRPAPLRDVLRTIAEAVRATRLPHQVRVTGVEAATFAAQLDLGINAGRTGAPDADLLDSPDGPDDLSGQPDDATGADGPKGPPMSIAVHPSDDLHPVSRLLRRHPPGTSASAGT